jgi:tRNA-Thr(GGU) m(6)t(6)A37 methyltransferase TsaA
VSELGAPPPEYALHPVGWVRSPIRTIVDAPCQGAGAPPARIVAEHWSVRCWGDLEVGDEIFVLTWLDRADRTVMTTHPEDDESIPLTGVFSTRSPDRPNPIGLHRTTVVARGTDWIEVANLEALDGTPVVDVKPVITEEQPGR